MARPRDPDLDDRVLRALRTLGDRMPAGEITMTAVAKESGVSRSAIYRRWPNIATLRFEAQTSRSVESGFPDLGSVRAELVDMVERLVYSMVTGDRELTAEQLGQMIRSDAFSASVWENRWTPDLDAMFEVWERSLARGEVRADIDGRAFMEDLVASCIFQVMLSHRDVDREACERLVDRVLGGVAVPGPATG
ncbi:MAG: TetR/AcrR family transcriptional regulator C-terminal ligand-binding domain-containing protein [Actinomycetota bacterium]